ncbi:MAG: Fic family protein [Candidatus Micrarchaeota archaeon]|nr:Fic family protein [Candidatus Micrarchaeota archaeon]
MVALKKRGANGKSFYYLSHTYRQKGKVRYKETKIGDKLPGDLAKLKSEFLQGIYKEKWFVDFGEIRKAYLKEQKLMPSEIREKNLEAFAVRFTYDTNRIEGSMLTLGETGALLIEGISPKDRPMRDVKEAESHRRVFYSMLSHKGDLSIGITLAWHKELFGETKPGLAGKIRDYGVYITNSTFRPPAAVELQTRLLEFFRWYSREESRMNPVELAALVHVKFETIHPFGDGNGRVGRLLMNFVLHRNGYPMIDIRYQNRKGYYRALERAHIKNDDGVFAQWFFKRYIKENGMYLKAR